MYNKEYAAKYYQEHKAYWKQKQKLATERGYYKEHYRKNKPRYQMYAKRYRAKHLEEIKEKNRQWARSERGQAWQKARRLEKYKTRKQWIHTYLMRHPCIDCGTNDLRVLDFDHINGKTCDIGTAMIGSINRLIKEIELCEVRCANCHRIRHANDKAKRAWQKRNANPLPNGN